MIKCRFPIFCNLTLQYFHGQIPVSLCGLSLLERCAFTAPFWAPFQGGWSADQVGLKLNKSSWLFSDYCILPLGNRKAEFHGVQTIWYFWQGKICPLKFLLLSKKDSHFWIMQNHWTTDLAKMGNAATIAKQQIFKIQALFFAIITSFGTTFLNIYLIHTWLLWFLHIRKYEL